MVDVTIINYSDDLEGFCAARVVRVFGAVEPPRQLTQRAHNTFNGDTFQFGCRDVKSNQINQNLNHVPSLIAAKSDRIITKPKIKLDFTNKG